MGESSGLTAMPHLLGRLHHPILRSLPSPDTPLGPKCRHDLIGQPISKLWLVDQGQDPCAIAPFAGVNDYERGSKLLVVHYYKK